MYVATVFNTSNLKVVPTYKAHQAAFFSVNQEEAVQKAATYINTNYPGRHDYIILVGTVDKQVAECPINYTLKPSEY